MTSWAIVVLLSAFAMACGPTGAADEPTSTVAAAPSTTLERPNTTELADRTTGTAAPPDVPRVEISNELTFTADIPGIFEVETHDSDVRLFDEEVSG